MENNDLPAPSEPPGTHPLRRAGMGVALMAYGLWLGLRWVFQSRRGLLWLAALVFGGWCLWGHRYEIAREWGRIQGAYQGSLEREREEARKGAATFKDMKKE